MNGNVRVFLVAIATFMFATLAFAQEGHGGASDAFASLGAGIGIAIAVFGGAMGQGRTASAALEGIGRNPAAADKLFVPMILGLALIESLVILAWLVTFVKIKTG
ncbi:MAG: ATP synthase F0 subunit C [Bdellovibrionota bacterium]